MPTTDHPSSHCVPEAAPMVKGITSTCRSTRRTAAASPAAPPSGGPPRPPRGPEPPRARGTLHAFSPVVAARLRDEGVPPGELRPVARQLWRILPLLAREGTDEITLPLLPWVLELIERYGDKLSTLFLTTREKVERV